MNNFRRLYEILRANIVPSHWWPAESRFEICVGAVLTQNTAWSNVESSLTALRAAGLLAADRLARMAQQPLAELIRPSGFMTAKSRCLITLAGWFLSNDDAARSWSTSDLRSALLGLRGIGEETADVLLLYCYDRPVFIFDSYARRLLMVAGLGAYSSYATARQALALAVSEAEFTVTELAELHGLIVDGGKLARKEGGWEQLWPRWAS